MLELKKINDLNMQTLTIRQWLGNDQEGFLLLQDKFSEGNLFKSWINPAGNLVLVKHEKWNKSWAVCDTNGKIITDVPNGVRIGDKVYGGVNWIWKDSQHLVGIMGHDIYPSDDYDEIDEVKMFVFKCANSVESTILKEVQLPRVAFDHMVRIDGISNEGYLILSDVFSDVSSTSQKFSLSDNTYRKDEKFLGVYDISKDELMLRKFPEK